MNLEKIINWITDANDNEIDEMIAAILLRQKKKYPEWEVAYLSFPLKDPGACREIMVNTWKILCKAMEEE